MGNSMIGVNSTSLQLKTDTAFIDELNRPNVGIVYEKRMHNDLENAKQGLRFLKIGGTGVGIGGFIMVCALPMTNKRAFWVTGYSGAVIVTASAALCVTGITVGAVSLVKYLNNSGKRKKCT